MKASESSGKGEEAGRVRIIERSSMKSPARQKQKPALWAGSLNEWCPDRTKTPGAFLHSAPRCPQGESQGCDE
ncbi:hypothetical protein AGJ31_15240 [Cronobacter turicensis]|nr:hypothetical protein [Cronobacter turicensis]